MVRYNGFNCTNSLPANHAGGKHAEEWHILGNEDMKLPRAGQDMQTAGAENGATVENGTAGMEQATAQVDASNYINTAISNRPASQMTEAEKKAERKLIRDRLKELNASPRSDYHMEFEDAVQLTIEAWDVGAWTIREHELGENPPRTDLIVVTGNGLPDNAEEAFSFFLLHNALEFKGPGDRLDWNTLRKVAGYGHFLIAMAKKEENITAKNVTLSVFASEVNETEFAEMANDGTLTSTSVPGVYSIHGLTDLPFQVVIIGELEGEAYAAYRVLKKHAEVSDVELLLNRLEKADEKNDQNMMDRLHRILDLVEKKNPGTVADKIEEMKKMKSVFMDVLKPEIDVVVKDAVDAAVTTATAKASEIGSYSRLVSSVRDTKYSDDILTDVLKVNLHTLKTIRFVILKHPDWNDENVAEEVINLEDKNFDVDKTNEENLTTV